MKKITITLFIALVFVFSSAPVSAGEGEIPIMGVTCNAPGKPACPPPPGLADPNQPENSDTFIKTITDYLSELFG